ncbi:MAG: FCD domain-containing protein, partial [Rhodoglobus sp.]
TEGQVARLRALLTEVDESTPLAELVAHDIEFHRLITEASGNRYLASLLDALSSETTRARVWRGLTQDGSTARTLAEHAAIVDALANHDAEITRSWVTVHVSGIESWLQQAAD